MSSITSIKSYREARPNQRVTIRGVPTDISQRKEVDRGPMNVRGYIGEFWYDLNIDGVASDLTATFELNRLDGGVTVRVNEVHVI